jgi:parvulin-like peptidyl-prolyl isomerase
MRLLNATKYLTVLAAATLAMAQTPAPKPAPKPAAPVTPVAPPAAPAAPAPEVNLPPETVVLTIGTEKITRAQFEDLLSALADNGRPANNPAAKKQVAEQLAELRSAAAEARRRKLDQTGPVRQMIAIQTDNMLASALGKQLSTELKPDEAGMKAYYEKNKSQYEQVKASHILIRFQGSRVPLKPDQKDLTKEEALAKAKEIQKKLVAGGDFAAIAKVESDDAGSGANGGSLGTFGHGQMVPVFDAAAFSQPIGQIGEPVESPFGYHIIKVEERTSKSFADAKPEIEKQMGPQEVRDKMEGFRKQMPVTFNDAYFGKP